MKKASFTVLIAFLALQMPIASFAQSFNSVPTSSAFFDPAVYGLSSDYREVPVLRTEKTLTFVKPDGKFVSIGAGSYLFTHDERGNLVPIEEKGKKTKDSIVFDRLPQDVVVHFDNDRPSYVYQKDNHWFRLSFAGQAKAELESPNVVRYRLADHAVLRFTVHGTTVSKAITIDGPIDSSIRQFSLEADSALIIDSSKSGITLNKADGTTVFESESPTLEETEGNILDHSIGIVSLGDGNFVYDYDLENLPSTYVIDPTTRVNSPSIVTDGGGGGTSWSGLSNLGASDDSYVSTTMIDGDPIQISNTLRTTGYGFSIADVNATISGVEVTIEGHNDNTMTTIQVFSAKLIKDGTVQGANRGGTQENWTEADDTYVYGSTSDLWSLTFTAEDISTSDFGFALIVNCWDTPCEGTNGDAEPRVDQITIQVSGTFSAGYIAYLDSFSSHWDNVCKYDSLEAIGCWCGWCGGLSVPPGISAVDAMDENIDMTQVGIAGGKLVRFKKGTTRIADVPIMFIDTAPSCNTLTMDADADLRKSFIHGIADYIIGTNSGYMLYVKKSVSDDHVRVCSGKTDLGCTTGDSWSFRANDSGTITETNGGFSTKDVSVSVADGYWNIFGMKETGGEGEDGGGGGGGAPVPEMPLVGLLLVFGACAVFLHRKILGY